MDQEQQVPYQQVPQPMPQQPVEVPHKSPMNKILLIILGMIFLVAASGGSYYLGTKNSQQSPTQSLYGTQPTGTPVTGQQTTQTLPTVSPTPDPTRDWKVYTNTKYGYSIKYPSNLFVDERNSDYHYVSFFPHSDGYTPPTYLVSVIPDTFIVKNVAAYNYMSADWIDNIKNIAIGETKTMDEAATFTRLKDMQIDGIDAVSIKVDATGYHQVRTYVKKNGYMYMISNYYQNPDEFANYTLFASCFKLTQ